MENVGCPETILIVQVIFVKVFYWPIIFIPIRLRIECNLAAGLKKAVNSSGNCQHTGYDFVRWGSEMHFDRMIVILFMLKYWEKNAILSTIFTYNKR